MKRATRITSIDLELNQPSNKVISIGAVIGDIVTGEIIAEFHEYVKIDEPLCTDAKICDIPKLTGITEEILENEGITLIEAYEKLVEFHKQSHYVNALTWGYNDCAQLRTDLERVGMQLHGGFHNPSKLPVFCFGRRHFDCKQRFQEQCMLEGKTIQGGLKKALKRCGLTFNGQSHNALYDALNTFVLYNYLLNEHIHGNIKGKKEA